MTAGKTIALIIWTFVGKVIFLIFNMLSRFVFSSKEQVSFNFMAAVTICSGFGTQESRVCHYFRCFHIICHEVMRPGAMIFVFLNVEFQASLFTLFFNSH